MFACIQYDDDQLERNVEVESNCSLGVGAGLARSVAVAPSAPPS